MTPGERLTDADYLEAHILARMLTDNPGDRRLQEAAWSLVGRLGREGKLSAPEPSGSET